jgi:predicted MFS family arabinose efflux permease
LIHRRIVWRLGLSQLICWGVSYYLIGGFGAAMVADLGWSRDVVYGGFSVSLLVTGLSSPWVGHLIDRRGGRDVMAIGSVVLAIGCLALAASRNLASYYGAWIVLGLAMRLTLYDAAFAALARLDGPAAGRPISQITLLGGLASTVFWPIGGALARSLGWRDAVVAYAGFALATLPLHLGIPRGRFGETAKDLPLESHGPRAVSPSDRLTAGGLYALIVSMASILNSGMSAHMIGILSGLGLDAAASVWILALRGVGQSLSRLAEVLFGRKFDPIALNLGAALLLPIGFVVGLFSNEYASAALFFAFCYGAGNGILTITRGTLPLLLFDHRTYGTVAGRLLAPSFLLSAGAPLVFAIVIEHFGAAAALYLSIALATVTFLSRFHLANQQIGFLRSPALRRFAGCMAWRGSLRLRRAMNNAPPCWLSPLPAIAARRTGRAPCC